jgi:cellulose synthase/poly-beta-1,6-N-acetylglucosamine synthase-like glycosyltransferase
MILLVTCGILFTAYSLLVLYYWYNWKDIPAFIPPVINPQTRFSVIIPARNEAENIGPLLQALKAQTYPAHLFEIIVIDDHSTDDTAGIVKSFPGVKLISLSADMINSYKKKAIETGIAAATGEWIVTTDADCLPPVAWLQTLAAFAEEKQAVFIAAPVLMQHNLSPFQLFQSMDFMILQAITGAVVHKKQLTMCNGANIAYSKKVFEEVNGFSGIDGIASGDDMLLMYKIWERYPDNVFYLRSKNAIVTTRPESTWKSFFNQRVRWASKARKYEDTRFFPVLLLVYLFNLSFLALLLAGFWYTSYWYWLLIFWGAKTVAEWPLFWSAARFFNTTSTAKWFFFFQPLHILYTIISGLLGQAGQYEWKGRKVN